MKPILSLSNKFGQLEILWVKGFADSIRIEVDRGDGNGFQFLTKGSIPNYTDLASLTSQGTWKYRAIYLMEDKHIGEWSEEVGITI